MTPSEIRSLAPLCIPVKDYPGYTPKATPSMTRIMEVVVRLTTISEARIKNGDKSALVVDARTLFSHLCALYGYGPSREAGYLGKEHSACVCRRQKAVEWLAHPTQWPEFFKHCSKAVAMLENKSDI